MRKRIGAIFLCFYLILHISSCAKAEDLIDPAAFDEAFYQRHHTLFYNESCEHDLRYQNMPDALSEEHTTIYHRVSCYYGNCGWEAHLEPHTIDPAKCQIVGKPMVKENGCLYHQVIAHCELCEIFPYFYIYVLCPKQDTECQREDGCLDGVDWRQLLCDTPYEILQD